MFVQLNRGRAAGMNATQVRTDGRACTSDVDGQGRGGGDSTASVLAGREAREQLGGSDSSRTDAASSKQHQQQRQQQCDGSSTDGSNNSCRSVAAIAAAGQQ